MFQRLAVRSAGRRDRVGYREGNQTAVEVDGAEKLGDEVGAQVAFGSEGFEVLDADFRAGVGNRSAQSVAEDDPGEVQRIGLGHEVARVGAAFLEVGYLGPFLVLHPHTDRPVGDFLSGQNDRIARFPVGREGLGLAFSLARARIDARPAPRDRRVFGRLEHDVVFFQTGPARRSCRDHQIRVERRGQGKSQSGGCGHRPVEPVADELAEVDDVLPLAGGGQEGLRRLGVEVVGQHVADAAEKFQQHHAEVGRVEIRPAVGELRHPRQQFPAQGVVVLVRVSDARSAHFRSSVAVRSQVVPPDEPDEDPLVTYRRRSGTVGAERIGAVRGKRDRPGCPPPGSG